MPFITAKASIEISKEKEAILKEKFGKDAHKVSKHRNFMEYVYDVYEVNDARDPHQVKNDVIENEHPFGDETKILRKTLAKVLKAQGTYDSADYAEFKQYNEFCEAVRV